MITKERVINIAIDKVKKAAVMNLKGRKPMVAEEDSSWHVSFSSSDNSLGGESHIVIDKKNGKYY